MKCGRGAGGFAAGGRGGGGGPFRRPPPAESATRGEIAQILYNYQHQSGQPAAPSAGGGIFAGDSAPGRKKQRGRLSQAVPFSPAGEGGRERFFFNFPGFLTVSSQLRGILGENGFGGKRLTANALSLVRSSRPARWAV